MNVENNPRSNNAQFKRARGDAILRKRLQREMPLDAVQLRLMFKQLLAQLPRAVNETFDPVFALLIQKDTRFCVSHRG